MKEGVFRRSTFLFTLVAVVLLVGGTQGRARLEGGMDSEIWLSPGDEDQFLSPDSIFTLSGDYLTGKVSDLPSQISEVLYWPQTGLVDPGLGLSGLLKSGLVNREKFGVEFDGYYAREFGPDYPIGTLGGSTKVSFSDGELEYWANKGIVNYAGFSYQGIFLLEKGPKGTGSYDSGMELSVSGTKFQGVTVEVKGLVGMRPNPRELVGNRDGSGYDTFTRSGKKINGYSESEISFENLKIGSLNLSSTSKFSQGKGFEKTEIDFSLQANSELLEFDGLVKFAPKKTTVSLTPTLDLNWACFDLYAEVLPGSITGDKNELTGFELKGFGMNQLTVGNVQISFLEALGANTVYRMRGEHDWRLRAYDYVFPESDRQLYYTETDYSGILSLEGGMGNLYMGADAYWSPGGGLFDFKSFTGEAEYQVSESFELTAGMVLDVDKGLQNVILNTVYKW